MKRVTKLVLSGMSAALCVGASVASGQSIELVPAAPAPLAYESSLSVAASDSVHRRPRAIEYSDWYSRRLVIHKIGSYTMLPLFATEYYLGNKLLNGDGTDTERNAHQVVAGGLGVLFGVNTITGLWNLYESRQDPSDRKKKIIHSALMIAADAGFALAGATGGGAGEGSGEDSGEGSGNRNLHKNIALGSMGISTVGAAMMWFWKD